MNERKVFFIEWKRSSIEFIKGITLSSSLTGIMVVHIFYSQDSSSSILPKYRSWLFKHPVSKDNGETAVWKAMEDYILRFKFTDEKSESCRIKQPIKGFLVSQQNDKHVIKLVDMISKEKAVNLKVIHSENRTTLLDLVDFKCSVCKIGFKKEKEVAKHDIDFHSFVCYNPDCHHSDKEYCFSSEQELQTHVRSQLRCKFCPGRVFCTREYLARHLKTTHKKCPCPCGEYFGSRQVFLDHFFSYYPTPKGITARYPSLLNTVDKKPNKKRLIVTKPHSVVMEIGDDNNRVFSPVSGTASFTSSNIDE